MRTWQLALCLTLEAHAQVTTEVRRHIYATRALETGGMFVASSNEINPPIPPENFRAMVRAVWETKQ